jgi:hypothetical protein
VSRMNRRTLIRIVGRLSSGAAFVSAFLDSRCARAEGMGETMNSTMMGRGMMGNSPADRHDMDTVMSLFANHEKIRRTVDLLPNGVRTTTESDDPKVTALLHAHVAAMYQRLDVGKPFTMMSPTLPVMFRNAKSYTRNLEVTPKGVVVIETAANPSMTQIIREHAREVTGFVRDGMSAMMRGMMNDH